MSVVKSSFDCEQGAVVVVSPMDVTLGDDTSLDKKLLDGGDDNNKSTASHSLYSFRDSAPPGSTSHKASCDVSTQDDEWAYLQRWNVYARYGWTGVVIVGIAVLFIIMLPVTFLSIIPEEIRREYRASDITVNVAKVINPTDEGFTSETTIKLSHEAAIPARLKVHKNSFISWEDPSGGKLVLMQDSNTIPINTNFHTLTSYARVIDQDAMSRFNVYAITAQDIDWHMRGQSTVTAIIQMDIDMDKPTPMYGFNNFSIPPVISEVIVTSGSPTVLYSSATATLYVESNMALVFGQDLYHIITVNDTNIGRARIINCEMYPGETVVPLVVEMFWSTTEEYDVLMRVLSNFMMGIDTGLVLKHFYLPKPVSWLTAGLDSIVMNTILPPVTEKMVVEIYMYPRLLQPLNIPVEIIMYNPIDTNATVTSLVCDVFYKGALAAKMNEQGLTILVPAKTQIRTPRLDSTNYATVNIIRELISAGYGLMDLYCQVGMTVGEFPSSVKYNQFQVPAYIQGN